MTRLWLAALGMMIAVASAAEAAAIAPAPLPPVRRGSGVSPVTDERVNANARGKVEVEVIDRKPVAKGAEVVLEVIKRGGRATHYWYSYRSAKAGVNWVFYKGPVVPDKAGSRVRRHEPIVLPPLFYNDERITFSHLLGSDAVVVTVDLDAAVPKVHEDRFVGACGSSFSSLLGGVSFQGVDELVIMDVRGRGFKRLKRDKEGTWRFADVLPYDENLQSQVSVFTPDYKLVEVIHHTRLEVPNLHPAELVEHFELPDAMTHLAMDNLERLKCVHRSFIHCKARGLTPTMDGGPDLPMPSMVELVIQNLNDADDKKYDCGWARMWRPSSMGMQMSRDYFEKDGWIIAGDLPCFATDYDKTVRGISATYELWMEYYDSRLLKSLQGVHTAGFFTFFEWEMARGTDEHEKALERRGLPARTRVQSR